jgi:hypothetical protein
LVLFSGRSHLPLRGKLGWMTPRAGVKTTPATERAFHGPPIPSGGPYFLGGPVPPLNFRHCISQFIRRHEHPRTVSSIPRFVDFDFRYTRHSSPNMERCVDVTVRPPCVISRNEGNARVAQRGHQREVARSASPESAKLDLVALGVRRDLLGLQSNSNESEGHRDESLLSPGLRD